jgi:hypothetical protein
MKKKIFITYLLVCFATISGGNYAYSQGGSNYSIYGFGDMIYGQTASSQALGGTQIAVPSVNTINTLNPAMWALVKTTRVQTGYRFNQNVVNSSEHTIMQNNGSTDGFYSIFNFSPESEMSAGIMFQPVSSVNYYMSTDVTLDDGDGLYMDGKRIYKGVGGLSNFTLGFATRVIKGVYVGATAAATLGKIVHSTQTSLSGSYLQNYQNNISNIFSGFNSNIGVYVNPVSTLGIGAFYQYQSKASVEARNEFLYLPSSTLNVDTVISNTIDKMNMPNHYGVGLSYTLGNVLLAADYLVANFNDVNFMKPSEDMEFDNLNKISFGVSILGSQNEFSSLSERISYRFGGYYENLHYKINNKQIKEYGISVGGQFPISRTSQFDIALVLGSRGMTTNGLLRESFGKLNIDISIGDSWFKKLRQ